MANHSVECAFSLRDHTFAYIFSTNRCVLIDYAPGGPDGRIINGPKSISNFFPSLRDTVLADGIDAAFRSPAERMVAYIFRGDMYACLNFVTGYIINQPGLIRDGFPSLRDTVFETGIDAAFASHVGNEVYLFKGDQVVRICHTLDGPDEMIGGPSRIADVFNSLNDTIFAAGLDAAFTAMAAGEAYIFKDGFYARINYAPGGDGDAIIGTIDPILQGFPFLTDFLQQ